jgi:small-conductance mechanosensitive channel
LAEPEPDALFLGFGDSSLNFQLRAWIDKFDEWVRIKSDLYLAIHDALSEAEIEIPFPQVDVNLRR